MVDRVNQLNRSFTVIFTEAMQSIKPLKQIQKIQINKPANRDEAKYSELIREWQNAFNFGEDLRKYVNKLNNLIILAGGSNISEGPNDVTRKSLEQFDIELDSTEFEEQMKSCQPKLEEDPDYTGKIKVWKKAFNFPEKLKIFVRSLKDQVPIAGKEFLKLIDKFIEDLEIDDKDEFLIKATKEIGGQEYKIDSEYVKERANKEVLDLIKNNKKIKNLRDEEKKIFKKIMTNAKENELEVKAENKIIEKKYDKWGFEMGEKLLEEGAKAVKKKYPIIMDFIAFGSIGVIILLMGLALACAGCTYTTETIETTTETVDGTTTETKIIKIAEINQTDTKDTNMPDGNKILVRNPSTEILESNIVIVLVSTIIAPISARILKEKFDIDITEKQIGMILSDGIKSVTMYANEADKLRDASGNIPRKYQKTLRGKAFSALKENYTAGKYKELVANVGSEIFDKAIENAVHLGQLERFPLEKKQVEEIIKQSIDALPQIVEWKDLDVEVKNAFIDGNIRKLLKNTGVNGWSHKALENVFDAEVSKRLIGAAIAEKNNLLENINSKDPYLKYTSTVIDAALSK